VFFIRGTAVAEADAWVRKNTKHENGFKAGVRLTHAEWEVMEKELNTGLTGGMPRKTMVIHQFAETMVHVPVGWMHFVRNVQPCLKAAWDFIDPCNAFLYARSQRELMLPFTEPTKDHVASVNDFLRYAAPRP
jgi:hypothetical protein